jgi:hypothetical protein
MKNSPDKILSFWLSCVREQDIQKTELANDLNAHQYISLEDNGNLVSNQRDSVRVNISKDLTQLLKNQRKSLILRNNNDSRPIFFFPLIEIKGKLSPLFFVDLTDYERAILSSSESQSFEINPWSIDTKIGVVTDTFVRLGYDEDHINLDDSIISFIESITGEFTLNFTIAMETLLSYLSDDMERQTGSPLKSFKQGVLKYSDFSDSTLVFKKDILMYLENKQLQEQVAFQDFLYRTEDSPKHISQEFYGSFQPEPLSLGQSQALSLLHKNEEKLMAIQGPPGTGKTTMLMSAIATQITQKAIAIASGRAIDMKPMLVTSYTNKAIDNISDRFESEFPDELMWCMNISLGNREKRVDAARKIKNSIAILESKEPDLSRYRSIKSILSDYKVLFSESDPVREATITKKHQEVFGRLLNKNLSQIDSVEKLLTVISQFLGTNPSIDDITRRLSALSSKATDEKQLHAIEYHQIKVQYKSYVELLHLHPLKGGKSLLMNESFYSTEKEAEIPYVETCNDGMFYSFINWLSALFSSDNEDVEKDTAKEELKNSLKDEIKIKRLPPLYEVIRRAKAVQINHRNTSLKLKVINEALKELELIKDTMPLDAGEFRVEHARVNNDIFKLSLEFFIQHMVINKDEILPILKTWRKHIDPNDDAKSFTKPNKALEVIGHIFPVITCTLSSISQVITVEESYLKENKIFSVAACDEAGMAPIFCMPTLLLRSHKILIVGDQKQLLPVINIDTTRINEFYKTHDLYDENGLYHPLTASLFQRAAFCPSDSYYETGSSIILNEHRRCVKEISNCFIEVANYNGLINMTNVDNNNEHLFNKTLQSPLTFIPTKADNYNRRNTNTNEVKRIKSLLLELKASGVDITKQVGIITPFQNQSIFLQSELRNLLGHTYNNKRIGTVHAFQGAEFDIIIFSAVVANKNFNVGFIDSRPNLINVACSRARHRFVLVGDYDFLSTLTGNMRTLISHTKVVYD